VFDSRSGDDHHWWNTIASTQPFKIQLRGSLRGTPQACSLHCPALGGLFMLTLHFREVTCHGDSVNALCILQGRYSWSNEIVNSKLYFVASKGECCSRSAPRGFGSQLGAGIGRGRAPRLNARGQRLQLQQVRRHVVQVRLIACPQPQCVFSYTC
jgi:hypothetical protein